MTHKELIADLSDKLSLSEKEVSDMLELTFKQMAGEMSQGNSIHLQGFGTFEAHRKEERVSVNPRTKVRTLIPPKQVCVFKPSQILKEKAKEVPDHE